LVILTRSPKRPYALVMFKEALRDIVERTEGGIAGLLMDASGIALETYSKADAPFDINTIGVEFTVVLGSIKKAAEMLDAGAANEVAISTDRMTTIIRMLGSSYFLALALRPDGNFGMGRYLIRTAAPKLLAEL
jgi:predicted regulator of Ras-like GTPase activity (Roadblock/LC7/MglB family)